MANHTEKRIKLYFCLIFYLKKKGSLKYRKDLNILAETSVLPEEGWREYAGSSIAMASAMIWRVWTWDTKEKYKNEIVSLNSLGTAKKINE